MDLPTPPAYLVREHADAICHSGIFDGKERLQSLLRFIVEQTLAGERTTETIIASAVWKDSDKSSVRENLKRLRKQLEKYYRSIESQTAIITISIPPAGLDSATRKFKHYQAAFSFHPEMLTSATIFAQVLHCRYDVPLSDGELWFNIGPEPVSLLRGVIQRHKAHAFLLGALYLKKADETRQATFEKMIQLYELAGSILDAASVEPEHQDFQVKLAISVATTMIRAVDTLASYFAEVTANRCAITEELRQHCETALASIFLALHGFKDLLTQRLLPLTGIRCKLYVVDYEAREGRCYYGLLVDVRKVEAFTTAMRGNKNLDLSQYGTVVASGWGTRPPGLEETLREAYEPMLVSEEEEISPPLPQPSMRPSA